MVGKYQAYPEYRESGNGWLEKVPVTWLNARMDDVALTIKEQVAPRDIESIQVMHYSIPTIQEIGTGREEDGATVDSNKFRVQEGDVLFSKLNPRKQTITTVRSHDQAVVASTEFIVLRSHSDNQQFLQYLLYSQELKSFVCSQVESATKSHQRINPSVVSKLKFALPSKEERLVIVKFLDHETAKIDTLIEKQQQLIQLLKEKRQAVISHAVTKGLNPNAPMRDSGVEWLGEVPEHWCFGELKFYARVVDCKHITAEFFDEGIPLASISEVKGWCVNLATAKLTNEKYYLDLIDGGRKPQTGDIIYSRNATVGEAALVLENMPDFAMGQDVCLIRLIEGYLPEYLLYVLKSGIINNQLDLAMVGSTFKRINVDDIRNFLIPSPLLNEQKNIVKLLGRSLEKHDTLISKAESAIELMQERRTALISAAVTGKIDVRHHVSRPSGNDTSEVSA